MLATVAAFSCFNGSCMNVINMMNRLVECFDGEKMSKYDKTLLFCEVGLNLSIVLI